MLVKSFKIIQNLTFMFLEFLEIIFALRGSVRQIIGKILTLLGVTFLLTNEIFWNVHVSGDAYLILFFFGFCSFLRYNFKPKSKIVKFFARTAIDYKKEVLANDILQPKPKTKPKKRKKIVPKQNTLNSQKI
jgi:hypothetical protein